MDWSIILKMIDFLQNIWLVFFFQPIYNLVIFTYNFSPGPSLGLALIGIAILIRFIFLYFSLQGHKHDKELAEIKPQIEKIENDNQMSPKEKFQRVSRLTKPLGINPFFSAVPLFAQIIFLGVLYQIIQGGPLTENTEHLYPFVNAPEIINTFFLGFDLTKSSLVLAASAAFILFLERLWEYQETKDVTPNSFSQKWDPLIWPIGTFIILMILPSAKAVFLLSSVVFSLAIKSIIYTREA